MNRIAALTLALVCSAASADELRLLMWNVDSDGSALPVIAKQLTDLKGYDIYGLTEVDPAAAARFRDAIVAGNGDFGSIVSETGNRDRLQLLYAKDRLELLENAELEAHEGVRMNDVQLRHRSPLMAKFRDKATDTEVIVVLVHFVRGDADMRLQQATGLRLWADDQTLPVIAIGDFNFDFDFPTQKGNAAFAAFLRGNVWRWVKPDPLVDTNWADRNRDGKDDYPDSCLSFAMLDRKAWKWRASSDVIVRDGDFPDDEQTSDHRPVQLIVELARNADAAQHATSDAANAEQTQRP